jgi:hypothetical protein
VGRRIPRRSLAPLFLPLQSACSVAPKGTRERNPRGETTFARVHRHLGGPLYLPEIRTGRMVYNNKAPVSQCSHGVTTVGGHNGNHARLRYRRFSVDGHFQLALNDFVNFFFGMEVLVNRGTGCELVMCERHTGRVEIAPLPPRQSFNHLKFVRIYKGHGNPHFSAPLLRNQKKAPADILRRFAGAVVALRANRKEWRAASTNIAEDPVNPTHAECCRRSWYHICSGEAFFAPPAATSYDLVVLEPVVDVYVVVLRRLPNAGKADAAAKWKVLESQLR